MSRKPNQPPEPQPAPAPAPAPQPAPAPEPQPDEGRGRRRRRRREAPTFTPHTETVWQKQTRPQWEVRSSIWGRLRVEADNSAEAVAEYCRIAHVETTDDGHGKLAFTDGQSVAPGEVKPVVVAQPVKPDASTND